MNRTRLICAATMLFFGSMAVTFAREDEAGSAAAGSRGIVTADHVQLKAKVEAIDYGERTIVLKAREGEPYTLEIGPEAKNFDQLKVGDQVTADFYASTAIFLRKSTEPPSARAADTVQLAAPGEKPGGIIVSTREMSARVDAIDPANRWIRLTGPRGNSASFRVSDTVQNLDEIKAGDQVVVGYTLAIALRVEKS